MMVGSPVRRGQRRPRLPRRRPHPASPRCAIWDYGTRALVQRTSARLLVICLALFASFVAVGVMIADAVRPRDRRDRQALLRRPAGRRPGLRGGRVPHLGASARRASIILAGVDPGRRRRCCVGLRAIRARGWCPSVRRAGRSAGRCASSASSVLPDVAPRRRQGATSTGARRLASGARSSGSTPSTSRRDRSCCSTTTACSARSSSSGTATSTAWRDFNFDQDPRSFPFDVLGEPPDNVMIIGAAGGHEILASLLLRRRAHRRHRAQPGHLRAGHRRLRRLRRPPRRAARRQLRQRRRPVVPGPQRRRRTTSSGTRRPTATRRPTPPPPGRSCCRRATCTRRETIEESLEHLADDGILAAQFGEFDFDGQAQPHHPLRRHGAPGARGARASTTRPQHVLVATSPSGGTASLSTILVKRRRSPTRRSSAFVEPGRAGRRHASCATRPGEPLRTTRSPTC